MSDYAPKQYAAIVASFLEAYRSVQSVDTGNNLYMLYLHPETYDRDLLQEGIFAVTDEIRGTFRSYDQNIRLPPFERIHITDDPSGSFAMRYDPLTRQGWTGTLPGDDPTARTIDLVRAYGNILFLDNIQATYTLEKEENTTISLSRFGPQLYHQGIQAFDLDHLVEVFVDHKVKQGMAQHPSLRLLQHTPPQERVQKEQRYMEEIQGNRGMSGAIEHAIIEGSISPLIRHMGKERFEEWYRPDTEVLKHIRPLFDVELQRID